MWRRDEMFYRLPSEYLVDFEYNFLFGDNVQENLLMTLHDASLTIDSNQNEIISNKMITTIEVILEGN